MNYKGNTMIITIIILLFYSVLTVQVTAWPASEPKSFTLSVGVVIQISASPIFYVMNQTSGIDAVDVKTGKLLWHSDEASAPLLARGNRLLVLLYPFPGKSAGRLRVLDTSSGKVMSQLPDLEIPGWSVIMDEGMGIRFELYGVPEEEHDFLVWKGQQEYISPVNHPNFPVKVVRGAVEVDLDKGTLVPTTRVFPDRYLVQKADKHGGVLWAPFESGDLSITMAKFIEHNSYTIGMKRTRGRKKLRDIILAKKATNFFDPGVSADYRHVMVAYYHYEKQDPIKNVYDITVFDLATGKKVGHLLNEAWPAAFVIWNDQLLYYFPDRVGVTDFQTGKQVFQHQVKDLTYRGSYPPAAAHH